VAAKWKDQESLKGLDAYYNLPNHFRFTLEAFIHWAMGGWKKVWSVRKMLGLTFKGVFILYSKKNHLSFMGTNIKY